LKKLKVPKVPKVESCRLVGIKESGDRSGWNGYSVLKIGSCGIA